MFDSPRTKTKIRKSHWIGGWLGLQAWREGPVNLLDRRALRESTPTVDRQECLSSGILNRLRRVSAIDGIPMIPEDLQQIQGGSQIHDPICWPP
jgi:hypothetical protein